MKTSKKLLLFIVAGEVSGDLYGALLSRALYKLNSRISIYGMGGKKMKEAGVHLVADFSSISVVGFTEVIPKLIRITATFRKVKRFILEKHPSVVILIDYPGFNLRLARIVKENKIPLLYYVSPQVWAWNKKRATALVSRANRIAVIFPFEKEWYHREGYKVEYVGHPLMEVLEKWQDSGIKIDKKEKVVGILPGSRETEVKRILPVMLKVAQLIEEENVRFILPLSSGIREKMVSRYISKSKVKVEIWQETSLPVIKAADLLLVASGTATLEAAYFQTPMIIIYKVSPLTFLLAKLLVKVPWIGLVNLIAGEEVVPEFIQRKARPREIAQVATKYLKDKEEVKRIKGKLFRVVEKIKKRNTSFKVAQIVLDLCKEE